MIKCSFVLTVADASNFNTPCPVKHNVSWLNQRVKLFLRHS